ncbi:MAG: CpaF family protein [Ilumatobacter sp.]
MAVDRSAVATVRGAVQAVLADEAGRRAQAGDAQLSEAAREALAMRTLRAELRTLDQSLVAAGRERLTDDDEAALVASVLANTIGRGPFDLILADPTIEDVAATRFDLVFTYHSDGSVRRRPPGDWSSETELANSLSHIARTQGRTERQFNAQHPLLTMRIGRGLRLAAQRDVSDHVSFTLRRNTLDKVSIPDLVGLGMFPEVIGDFLRALGSGPELRVAFGGATGAGKTTVCRAILNEQPPARRIVVIEDTAELDLFDEDSHPNVESWEQREPNGEGEGSVLLSELVRQGLRNRPDLLIVGEVRGADAAVPMLEAMTHGQASLTTVHADDARGVLSKLALFLGKGDQSMSRENAHDNLAQALDFVVHVSRGRNGRRFVSEILEVAGFDGSQVTTNVVYQAESEGHGHALHRMSDAHAAKLRRGGFEAERLGGVWR